MIAKLAGFILLGAATVAAQATLGSATASGTVRDASGAAVPGAKVALTDVARGLTRETVANEAGTYLFPSIPAAVYTLRVTQPSFDAYELKGLRVEVGQNATVDVELKVGQISTVVSVSAEQSILLDTESNAIGTVVDSERVQSLPLNGRNFLQLALLAGGSTEILGRANVIGGQVGHPDRGIIVTGNMPQTTGYLINGISTRGGRLGESAVNLSIAGVDQFKVQQNFFMPDQGPNPGLVNVTTKGGTNSIHGQAFEFARNELFDARNSFAPAPEDLKRNQFGFALGGPIIKDRMWFYGNYEGLREITAFSARGYTPTRAMFGGDLREAPEPLYDPDSYSQASGARQPFPGNVIPSDRINPVSRNLLQYYLPGSSLAQRPSNVFGNPRNLLDDDQFGARIDASLTGKQNLFGQFIWQDNPAVRPGLFPVSGAIYPNESQFFMVQHTYTVRPTLINTLRAGVVRNLALFSNEARDLGSILPGAGITNTFDTRGITGIGIQGFSGFGRSNGDLGNIDNNYQMDEGANYVRGKHNFQFGLGVRYRRTWQQNSNANAHGSLGFQPVYTARLAPNAQGQLAAVAGTGNAFADFLLGTPASGQMVGLPMIAYRFTQYLPYIQDTWKVTRGLTLNYGLSWFLATVPSPQGRFRDLVHGFDEARGLLTYAKLGQIDPRVLSMDKNNFTPRVGFAWKPGFSPNTVVRAGAGIYYADTALIELQFAAAAPPFNTPVQIVTNPLDPTPPYRLGRNIFPSTPLPPLDENFASRLPNGSSAFLLKEDGRNPYISQWNVSIQHSIRSNDLVEVVYMGSGGHRIQNRYEWSQCRPGADLRCVAATRPYGAKYSNLLRADFNGNSTYHAMVAKFQHRASAGLNLRAEYTFAKALTDSWESGSSTDSQITNWRRGDKGPATFDLKHRAVFSAIYELPFGRGRRFGRNMNRAADLVVGGWMTTAITGYSTGPAFYVTSPNQTGSAFISHRPNRLCGGADSSLANNLRNNGFRQFDTACFVTPPASFFGNTGRAPLYGPGINNWDIGIEKDFSIHEQTRLEFRGEMFNAFNHTQFGLPNADTGSGVNFGRVAGARPPRLIQLGMKLLW
ncbi:MAG: carboxypeptidase regulatory-like domain-containing protein [Acidobacteria bacterium]|nr:carboxypeptidase regulatory-like domain-containing protein [Acidobacteriota bacterium]